MVFHRDKEINKKLLIKTVFETLGRGQSFAMDMENNKAKCLKKG